ncbi:head decoration protein [Peribacillus phoenicis]|uniref:head decoration protein n=1 Tax=unclassified Peribacillus TaxID=2675266 RepID=UPI0039A18D17
MPEQLGNTLGSFEYDNLFAGGVQPVVTDSIIVKSGQSYVRGSVLAKGADGIAVLVDSASATASIKKPFGILTDDVDATTENVPTTVYLTGEFNQEALVFGGTDTFNTHKGALRDIGIILKKTQKA